MLVIEMSTHDSSHLDQARRPRKLRGRQAALVIGAAFFVTMLGPTLPTPLYPIYQDKFGFEGLMVTSIFTTYVVGIAAALLLFGRLSDRIGRRALLLPGLLLAMLSSAVFYFADTVELLFFGRLLSGLSVGIITGTATAALTDLAPAGRQRLYSLIAALVNMVGLGLGPVMAGALAEFTPFPLTLPYFIHIVLLIVTFAGVSMIAEPLECPDRSFRWEFQGLTLPPEVRGTFLRAATAGFAGFSVLGLFASVAPALLLHVLGIGDHLVCGLVVFAQLGFSALGQIGSTKMADRKAMLIGTGALTAGILLTGISIAVSSLPVLLLGAAFAGAGQGMSFRASLSTLAEQSPAHLRGEITSTFFLVLYIAQSVPVMGVGVAASAVGLAFAGVGFAVFVAFVAAAAFASLLVFKPSDAQV
jgi:MFS family permease